jgi:type III secretion protein J
LLVAITGLFGCSVPVAGGLDERDATLVADVLQRAGLDPSRETDPSAEGRWRVLVARDDAAGAIAALREHDLPPRHAPGLADAVGKGSLVPSPLAEHAQLLAGTAGDLERTLASVDGVLGARVHLSSPAPNPLADRPADKPTASVLVRFTGPAPPIGEPDVRRLVAGSVASLRPEDVTVVMVARPTAAPAAPRPLSHLGPIAVTAASAAWLRSLVAVAVLGLLALTALVVVLWLRVRRLSVAGPSAGERA